MTARPDVPIAAPRTRSARLELRLSPEQRRLLEQVASISDQTMTEFVVRSFEVAARDLLADRTRFVLGRDQWEAFSAAIDRQPRVLPRLAAFIGTPSAVDQE